MASLIRRFKGKSKPSDKETDETNQDTVTPEKDEKRKSMSLSPYTSDSDTSPQHLISQGSSLFSGMKLTKTSRELEPESSPYTPGGEGAAHNYDEIMSGEDNSGNHEIGSSFTFINQSEPPTELLDVPASPNNHQSEDQSGFSFLMGDSSPPTDVTVEEDVQKDNSGFLFLNEDPDSQDLIPQTEESHSNVSTKPEAVLIGTMRVSTNTDELSSIEQVSTPSVTQPTSSTMATTVTPTSPVTTPTPLTPNPTSPSILTHVTQIRVPITSQKVSRQAPPNKKKKKHKAIRPGQERNDEVYHGLMESPVTTSDLDGISISSHGSSSTVEPSYEEGPLKQQQPDSNNPTKILTGKVTEKTLDETMVDDTLEANGETMVDSGDTLEPSRETMMDSGDTLECRGETMMDSGDTLEPRGETMMDSADTLEPRGETMMDSGDTLERRGETMMDSGDTLERRGETMMDSGDTLECRGETMMDSGDTLERRGETMMDSGDTQKTNTSRESSSIGTPATDTLDMKTIVDASDTSETMVGDDDTGDKTMGNKSLLVDLTRNKEGDESMKKENSTEVDRDLGAKTISSDLADVFDHVTNHTTGTKQSSSESKPVKEFGNYTVELSPIEKITALLEVTDSNAKAIRDSTEEIADQFRTVLHKHFKAIETQTKKRHFVQELKTKEVSALSEENYEQAEEFRKELESISVGNDVTVLMDVQTTVKEWLDKCDKSISSQVLAHHEAREKLKELQEEQTDSLSKLEKDFSSINAKEKMKLQTLRDELERERGHISLDSEHLKKRQLLLQDEVSERASEFIVRKEVLEIERNETLQEIEDLEKKLFELKQKESELLVKIRSEDESITTISNEFSTERDQMNAEEAKLDKKRQDLLNEESSLNELQLSFDASLKLHNENKERIQLLLKEAEAKITEISNDQCLLEDSLVQSSEWELEDIYEVLKPDHDLQRLLANESSQEDVVRQTSNEVLSLQTSISSVCRKLSDQETHLQKLQETKKVAVSARQYREAARVSTEEKVTLASCSELREEVKKLEDEVQDTNEKLLAQTQELDKLREKRELLEREEDIKSIKKLALTLVTVQENLQCMKKEIPFHTILSQWQEFIKLIVQDLCTKHKLDIQEYLTAPTADGKEETPTPLALPNSTDDMDSNDGLLYLNEERTPGVGMEVEQTISDIGSCTDVTLCDEIKQSIESLEKRIAECCENEEFEEAAALDEELQELRSRQLMKI